VGDELAVDLQADAVRRRVLLIAGDADRRLECQALPGPGDGARRGEWAKRVVGRIRGAPGGDVDDPDARLAAGLVGLRARGAEVAGEHFPVKQRLAVGPAVLLA